MPEKGANLRICDGGIVRIDIIKHANDCLELLQPEQLLHLIEEPYRQAIEEYLHSLRFAESDPNMSIVETLGWIQRPIRAMLRTLGEDIAPYLKIIEDFPKNHGDIPLEGAKALLSGLAEAYIPNDARTRQKTSGLLRRTIDRLERLSTDDPTPGADYLIDMLSEVCKLYR